MLAELVEIQPAALSRMEHDKRGMRVGGPDDTFDRLLAVLALDPLEFYGEIPAPWAAAAA